MKKCFYNATLVLPDKLLPDGWLLVDGEKIAQYGTGEPAAADERIDCGGAYLSPGFIDVHCHGGGGGSFQGLDLDSHVKAMKAHLAHGVTAMTPAPTAATPEELRKLAEIKKQIDGMKDVPHHLGYFLEAMGYCQPHPDIVMPDAEVPVIRPENYEEAIEVAKTCVKRWMAAPELEGALGFGRALRNAGIIGCMGHSNATYREAMAGFENGYSCAIHLYSVMSTVTRDMGFRRGGLVEAALLTDDMDVEIICDGCHLPPELIRLAVKCKGYDRLMLVSDCGPLGGCPEGEYEMVMGEHTFQVVIEDGVCKPLARNCFLGSVAMGNRLVRTVYKLAGIPLWGAVRMATKTPARHCGLAGVKGEIRVGCDADLVLFDEDINIRGVWLMGEKATV